LNAVQITENVVNAVTMELLDFRPELRKIPMNLSWMGMGDPFLDLEVVSYATGHIFDEVSGYIQEIEGVDIATSLPRISYDDKKYFDYIDSFLNNTKKLTKKPLDRTDVRLFYSLHAIREGVRRKMIPHSIPIGIALDYLYDNFGDYNIIYHAIFLEGINDKRKDIEALRDFFEDSWGQIRVLRYNKCKNSIYNESENFNEIINYLDKSKINMKVQMSPGSEISAACGMFLMK
jgi:23S rRNA (adenine2503-C2)-methyltransferase